MTDDDVVVFKLIEQIADHDPSSTECFFLGYLSAVNDMVNSDRRRTIEEYLQTKIGRQVNE